MAGVFETVVADIEKSKSISGLLTFNALGDYIDQYIPYLSYTEHKELRNFLSDYELMWSKHIEEVLINNRYTFAVSRPVELVTPQNWGEAIHIAFRILTMANMGLTSAIARNLESEKIKQKVDYCHAQTLAGCVAPCRVSKKLGAKRCKYNKLKDPVLIDDLCRAKVLLKAV